MRKKTAAVFLAALLFLVFALPVPAAATENSKIDITVTLNSDGSADVTQVWQCTNYDGTELYLPINTEGITITGFKVADENGPYSDDGAWDVDRSFEEKAGKYGIVEKSDGVELCWGLSEYGRKTYTFSYKVGSIMGLYTDYAGFNFQFVNDNMSLFPADVTLSVKMADSTALNSDNTAIWAFGFNGEINFDGKGGVYAVSAEPLDDDMYMNIMMRFDRAMFSGGNSYDHSFSELEKEAKKGSDYKKSSNIFWMILGIGILLAIAAVVIWLIVIYITNTLLRKKLYRDAPYYRDTPNGGDIDESYWIAKEFSLCRSESSIIGAEILKLINAGCLRPITQKEVGLFGSERESVNLAIAREPDGTDKTAAELFGLMRAAAGDNGVLEEKEMEKYLRKHPSSLRRIIDGALRRGNAGFAAKRGYAKGKSGHIKDLTDRGRDEVSQMMGLKKFLLDFSLIDERGINESLIWQNYLVYASLMDIADKVISQMRKIYPDYSDQYDIYERNIIVASTYNRCMFSSMSSAESARSSGGGGSSSFGGGGGFSGGGSGGGVR